MTFLRLLALAFLVLALSSANLTAQERNAIPRETREETVRIVWETVRDRYFDPTFGGLDWDAIGKRYTAKAIAAPSDEAFYEAVQQMLSELGQSHFQVLPPFFVATKHLSRGGDADAGIELVESGGQMLLWRFREGVAPPAALRPGCAILAAGDTNLRELREQMQAQNGASRDAERLYHEAVEALFKGRSTERVSVRYRCGEEPEDEVALPLTVSNGERSERLGFMPSLETRFETTRLPGDILVIRFNLFVMTILPRVREAIQQAAWDGVKGIVFDVRGNPGGIGAMANGIVGYLLRTRESLGLMKMRGTELKFLAFPQDGAFYGPVAVLIDRNSASTSEIFAAGLQELGRAVVVGERSMGAALPSFIVQLPRGALLQYAVADFVTPKGVRIEGKGVTPDIPAALTAETLLAGQDAQIEAARAALASQSPANGIVVTGQ